jgi:hypothetical protein
MARKKQLKPKEKEELKNLIYNLNNYLLDILNLYSDRDGFIRDCEDGSFLQVRGKFIKLRNISKEDIPFRPLYNAKLMMLLNGMVTMKLEQDGRHIEYTIYSDGDKKKDKLYIGVKEKGYDCVYSQPYFNDSLRYVDIISQILERPIPIDLLRIDELMSNK